MTFAILSFAAQGLVPCPLINRRAAGLPHIYAFQDCNVVAYECERKYVQMPWKRRGQAVRSRCGSLRSGHESLLRVLLFSLRNAARIGT